MEIRVKIGKKTKNTRFPIRLYIREVVVQVNDKVDKREDERKWRLRKCKREKESEKSGEAEDGENAELTAPGMVCVVKYVIFSLV